MSQDEELGAGASHSRTAIEAWKNSDIIGRFLSAKTTQRYAPARRALSGQSLHKPRGVVFVVMESHRIRP